MEHTGEKREIVPLNALRAFEAAGRRLSFVAAAEELFVTPAAISHHIKALEILVGTPLFIRRHRAIELTDAGRDFIAPLTKGLRIIEDATTGLRRANGSGPLRVRVAACIASKWLLPRLESFYKDYPHINLQVTVSSQIQEFRYSEMDAMVRLRKGEFIGMDVHPFLSEYVTAVCSPELLKQHGPVNGYDDLLDMPLLHDENLRCIPTYPDWYTWLASAGIPVSKELTGHSFDSSSMVLDATLEGKGVSLARSALVAEDLAAGRLVRLGDFDYPVTHDYFLIHPVSSPKVKQIRLFQQWLLKEAAKTEQCWSNMKTRNVSAKHKGMPVAMHDWQDVQVLSPVSP